MSADTPSGHTRSNLSPIARAERPVGGGLAGLAAREISDLAMESATVTVLRKHGGGDAAYEEAVATSPPVDLPAPREPRPVCPIAPHLDMPLAGEAVEWGGNFRAEIPRYVFEQMDEYCHRRKRTQVAALLEILNAHRDSKGQRVFFVREEDMVPDRRKVSRRSR